LAVRSKTQFFANISHELRTPLNAVIGLTSSLLGRELDDDVREDLEIVHSSGGSLLRIINDILDISKSESGKLAVENSVTDLRAMVSDVTALYRMNAQDRSLFLEVDFEGPNEPVLADPTRIKQIVGNLVSNALKFTSEGGVEVRLITTLI
jgi:two-component system CheB/CheR fusion protein